MSISLGDPKSRQPGRPTRAARLLPRHARREHAVPGRADRRRRRHADRPGWHRRAVPAAFGNLLTVLREVGGEPADLVSVTIYLTDVPDYQAHGGEIGAVWRELAGRVYPAMAGIGCTALWQPEAMIEILGVAVIPEERLEVR